MILPAIDFAACGFSSKYSENDLFIACSTAGFTSLETNFSLVCEENFGSGTFTETIAVKPSRASSPETATFSFLSKFSFSM